MPAVEQADLAVDKLADLQMAERSGVRETQKPEQCLEILQVRIPDFPEDQKGTEGQTTDGKNPHPITGNSSHAIQTRKEKRKAISK